MNDPGNHQIRKLFEELRRSDRQSTPPLVEVLKGRRARSSPWLAIPARWMPALAGLALLFVVVWLGRTFTETPAEVMALSAWRAPTDFLLVLPGNELLSQPQLPDGGALAWGFAAKESVSESDPQKEKEEPQKR